MSSDIMPGDVGVLFAHACLQVVADDYGVDLLHIKGPALDQSLLDWQTVRGPDAEGHVVRPVPRKSVDADVLVRPSHMGRLFHAMTKHGWRMAYDFADGSAFEHASTWEHDVLEHVDVHRRFPGIGLNPEVAFELLWRERQPTILAGQSCWVPNITAQRLILILHAVRGGLLDHSDIQNAWTRASVQERHAVEEMAVMLDAQVALAAGTGRLEQYRGHREYDLWKVLSTRESSLTRLWLARVKSQRSAAAAIRMGVKLVLPNRNRTARRLGRQPTAREMSIEYVRHAKAAAAEMWKLFRTDAFKSRSGGRMR